MSSPASTRPPAIYRFALYLFAFQVPPPRRSEWLAEWNSELWYVWEALSPPGPISHLRHGATARFCLGAMEDIHCLRKLQPKPVVKPSGSATACAALLALVSVLCFALAQLLPGVRQALEPSVYQDASTLVAITPSGLSGATSPSLHLGTVRSWQDRSQHLFSDFAFYQPVIKSVHIAAHNNPELTVARSSPNLLALLGVEVPLRKPNVAGDTLPVLVLSESTWKSRFSGRPEIFGQAIRVGLETVRLGGVVADQTTPAPGRIDAWLLLPASVADGMPANTRVFAFGRTAAQTASTGDRWHMEASAGEEHSRDFECVTLSARELRPWRIFAFTLFLALLSLPATTSLPLGDYAARRVGLPWTTKLRRWVFLAGKIALLLPAIYFGSLDLAYALPWSAPNTPQYIQLVSSFAAILFGLRWALRDQRQRCPVCLGKLTCPARVGQPSRNFLSWNGTELICSGGHGFLHVPELPTSWFSTPRWLHLDPSWSSLFPQPT